ncbi:MAG: glycosyltransferase family 2 protein [Mangrovicoccus sp.]
MRALWRARDLEPVKIRVYRHDAGRILLFATLRNELDRLPYFLDYYRRLGVGHFHIIAHRCTDGSEAYLARQADVSLWRSTGCYKRARFGLDWLNRLLRLYGVGHWCLTVDADEFLVYPHWTTRRLPALTHWLEQAGYRSFGALVLDLYPDGFVGEAALPKGDPTRLAAWFDPGNYRSQLDPKFGNLWIQGGPRERAMFATEPQKAPALNKIPLVKWDRRSVYASSTHMLLPRGLNRVFDTKPGGRPSGCLLHTKFLGDLPLKAAEAVADGRHYSDSREYKAYLSAGGDYLRLRNEASQKLQDWRQLADLNLMTIGGWV